MSLKADVSTSFTGPLQVAKKLSKRRIVFVSAHRDHYTYRDHYRACK